MKPLANNQELFDYLRYLATEFRKRKSDELSDVVIHASRHAADMSTEFLGEARIALRRVLKEGGGILDVSERNSLTDVIKQLDEALDNRR
jgi:hypothetical protein